MQQTFTALLYDAASDGVAVLLEVMMAPYFQCG